MAKQYKAVNNLFVNNAVVAVGSVLELDDDQAESLLARGSVVEFDGKTEEAPAAPEATAPEAPLPPTDSPSEESKPVENTQPSPEEIQATLEQTGADGPTSSDVQLS